MPHKIQLLLAFCTCFPSVCLFICKIQAQKNYKTVEEVLEIILPFPLLRAYYFE